MTLEEITGKIQKLADKHSGQFQGKANFSLERYEKAVDYLQKSFTASNELKIDFPFLQEMLFLLAKSYEKLGDANNAITYFNLFYEKDKENKLLSNNTSEALYKKYDIPTFKEEIEKFIRKVSLKTLKELRKHHKELNIHWIITGEGEMFLPNKNTGIKIQ